MKYVLDWSPQAMKHLEQLERHVAERIVTKLDEVLENPFRYLEHYEGQGYKLRIGEYRLLIDVDSTEKVLFVRVLDKRGRIYK
jgi:mRNA interferase RelE/StbE